MQHFSTSLSLFDYLIFAFLLIGLLLGLARGFFRELFVVIIWGLSFALAVVFSEPLSSYTLQYIQDDTIAFLITFVIIFFVVWVLGSFISLLFAVFMKPGSKSFLSRIVGMVLGVLQGAIAAMLTIFILASMPQLQLTFFDESVIVQHFKPMIADLQKNILPTTVVAPNKN